MTTSLFTPAVHNPVQMTLMACLNLPESAVAAHERITEGLDTSLIKEMSAHIHMDVQQLCRMAGIDRSTYNRRIKNPEHRFSPEQSARVYVMARVITAASHLFGGNTTRMTEWLNKPTKALAGKMPAELLSTPTGAEAVMILIGRLEYGVIT